MGTTKGEREGRRTGRNRCHSPHKRGSDATRLPQSHTLNHTRTSVQNQ